MPILFGGYGNIIIPLVLGISEVIYPRVNNLSILIVPLSFIFISTILWNEYILGLGWTLYPPLVSVLMIISPFGIDIILIGLGLVGLSSSLSSVNYIATIQYMRSIGL